VKLINQGLVNLNQECRAYASDIVLNPTQEIKSKYYVNFIPKLGIGSLSFNIPKLNALAIPKYTQGHDLLRLDNVHKLAHSLNDIQTRVDEEIDRQSGNVDLTTHYMIYVLLGLLLFSLVLILLLYVMCRYSNSLKKERSIGIKPVRQNKEPIGTSQFYKQEIYEPMIVKKKIQAYDVQGPIVECKSYEEKELRGIDEVSDTVD